MRIVSKTSLVFMFFFFVSSFVYGQDATLSFQGVLKKSNGTAVEDGNYSITFKLYPNETGGASVWTQTIPNVEVTSGIYSVLLGGMSSPLNVPFNQIYYLGVQVGSTELTPRFRLTSAPYAFSLIGQTNIFPSSGIVKADSIGIAGRAIIGASTLSNQNNHSLDVNGGILAKGGSPGSNGVNNAGYAFEGNNGDKDSGLFSDGDGQVSIYTNNVERVKTTDTGISVIGTATIGTASIPGNVNLSKGGTIVYNGKRDWILVDTDDFSTSTEGWQTYETGSPVGSGALATPSVDRIQATLHQMVDWFIRPSGGNKTIKKEYTLDSISHTEVKIEFNILNMNTWEGEYVCGGFAPNNNSFYLGWLRTWDDNACICQSFTSSLWGQVMTGEIVVQNTANQIWAVFTSTLNELQTDESWGITNIRVYIR